MVPCAVMNVRPIGDALTDICFVQHVALVMSVIRFRRRHAAMN
jgi:hypothetical protein